MALTVPLIAGFTFPLGKWFSVQLYGQDAIEWRVSSGCRLPPGVSLTFNGVLSGVCAHAGAWVISIDVNSLDAVTNVKFPLSFFKSPNVSPIIKKAKIDTQYWTVLFSDAIISANSSAPLAGSLRYGDVVTFDLTFFNGNQLIFPFLSSIRLGVKGIDTEPLFFETSLLNYRKVMGFEGDGYAFKYYLNVGIRGDSLKNYLNDFELDAGTHVNCICFFEFNFAQNKYAERICSELFFVNVIRDTIV